MMFFVSESIRNQVIVFIGVFILGVIVFFFIIMVGNLMVGIVFCVNCLFKVGDFIKVEGYSGCVIEMGLFDVEIQIESREFIVFVNMLMVNLFVFVIRVFGVIVSVDISLGYDIYYSIIEKYLFVVVENVQLLELFV